MYVVIKKKQKKQMRVLATGKNACSEKKKQKVKIPKKKRSSPGRRARTWTHIHIFSKKSGNIGHTHTKNEIENPKTRKNKIKGKLQETKTTHTVTFLKLSGLHTCTNNAATTAYPISWFWIRENWHTYRRKKTSTERDVTFSLENFEYIRCVT